MGREEDDFYPPDPDDWEATRAWEERQQRRELSPAGIAEQNAGLLRRYHNFRRAADAVAAAWRKHAEVQAIALLGSLAAAPWKEVPRFSTYRRKRIELWHECGDIDLALWLEHTRDLDGLRRAKDRALHEAHEAFAHEAASHHVDAVILEPGTDRFLGHLCGFNRCPRGKLPCLAEGCGDVPFLRQVLDFEWQPEGLAADRAVRLFDHAGGLLARAADLPLPAEDEA